MPPKPAGGKKPPILIEGKDTTEMTFAQLQQYMIQINEKLQKEREERDYFQLERDKLRTFWEISRRQLEEARDELRNKDYELELAEERRLKDLHEVNQKVKFLLYEQSLHNNELAIKEKDTLMLADKEYHELELELLSDKKELKSKLKALDESQHNENKALKLLHGKEISDMRSDFEKKSDEMEYKFEKKIINLRTRLETKQKLELTECEERKNTQIKVLTDNHRQAFDDIRNYYNNITLNNFSLITNLKDSIEDMKRKEAVKDKHLREVLKDNRALAEDIEKGTAEMETLKHQLATYKKETLGVTSMKRELHRAKTNLDKLKWDYDVLNIRFENMKNEKNKSEADKMTQAVEIQREIGGRITYLEEKIKALKGQVERRENVINEIRLALQLGRQMGDKGPVMKEVQAVLNAHDEQHARRLTHRQSLLL